ncbi:MAG: stage III sporulation protein AF [Clostridiales bacterium]|jgi:stage III sporulation protein AF|nr:stage III sporulation protein AF [Clostridiales bacterium]
MDSITGYVKTVAIFLILLSFVRILAPSLKYKPYLDLVMGLILISAVISPLSGILQGQNALLPALKYKINSAEIKNEEYILDEQNKMILDTYMGELKIQVENIVSGSEKYAFEDAEFQIGNTEDNFGEVLSVRVLVSEKDEESAQNETTLIRVDGVKVRLPNQKTPQGAQDNNAEISRIKNLISSFYNMSVRNIYLTVRKIDGGNNNG